jgi:thiamine biosynthesis lipoprotein
MIRKSTEQGEGRRELAFPLFVLGLLLLALAPSCGERPTPTRTTANEALRLQGPTMGTTWSASLHGTPAGTDWQARLQAELDEIEATLTTWNPESELMQLNAAGQTQGEPGYPVSEITWGCLQLAHSMAQATGGAFDPTIQPLVALWGFGKDRELPLPTEAQIEAALAITGWDGFSVSFESRVVHKTRAVQLDLSAIAKGCAADLEIDPDNLFLQAVATSGDSRNWRTVDGVRFSHIIDPRTGRPVENPPASVTVVGPTCGIADAWATALLVLGPEVGLPLAVNHDLEVCFQIREADGSFREICSEGYTRLLAAPPKN